MDVRQTESFFIFIAIYKLRQVEEMMNVGSFLKSNVLFILLGISF